MLMLCFRRLAIAACVAALMLLFGARGAELAGLVQSRRAAASAYREGSLLQVRGQLAEAAAAYRQAIAALPTAFEAYRDLAQVEFLQGHYGEAIAVYRQMLQVYPFKYTASLYRDVGFIELRAGQLVEAREDLSEALALDGTDWLAYHYLGHVYRRLGDTQAARTAWQRALELRPDFKRARDQLDRLDTDVF